MKEVIEEQKTARLKDRFVYYKTQIINILEEIFT